MVFPFRLSLIVAVFLAGVLAARPGMRAHGAYADEGQTAAQQQPTLTLPDGEPSPRNADPARIATLVKQLGSTTYQDRATAQKELEAIGVPALEELRRALPSADLETSRRAAALIRRIEEKRNTEEALSPKLVRLNLASAPVDEAIHLLADQTGYRIAIHDKKAAFANKRVTLDAGPVPFWQALDAICEQAGLGELAQPRGRIGIPANGMDLIMWEPAAKYEPVFAPIDFALRAAARVKTYTSITGSVRTRLFEIPGATEFGLLLDVTPEPRLVAFRTPAAPSFLRAVDDQGQERTLRTAKLEDPDGRQWLLHFMPAPKPAKKLKLLQGSLTAQILAPGDVTYVVHGLGKMAAPALKAKDAAGARVDALTKASDGTYELRLFLQPFAVAPRLAFSLANDKPAVDRMFMSKLRSVELLDTKGNALQMVGVPYYSAGPIDQQARIYTFQFRADAGQGEPEKLIVYGSTPVTVVVPFVFANVALE